MWKKIILEGSEARDKFLKGVEVVDRVIGNTLGPWGRNRILQTKYKAPFIINDGANIARRIVLDDPLEDLAAQTIIEVSLRTAEQAGDGTTASVVIASEIVRHCMKILKEGDKSFLEGGNQSNPMQMWRDILSERDKAVAILKSKSKELKDKDLDNIISTSLENLEYSKTLGELLRTIGTDGYISVEDNWATKYGITTEITTGMRFLGTYASPYLATSSNQKEAVWEDTHVIITNHKLETINVFKEMIEKEILPRGIRKLVIIGGYSEGAVGFSNNFVETIAKAMFNSAKGGDAMQILAIKAPSLTSTELEDVATFCGATFIDKNLGVELPVVKLQHLGLAKKISVTDSEVNIIGGKGKTEERIKVLKEQVELEKDQMFAEKLKRRIASLSSGVGIIRVGAQTESERSYLKYKLEDAVSAAKVAREEGYVKGGGLALKEVAEELGKDSILYSALMAPYERIKQNAGGNIVISKEVIDPTKVVRLSLENACSGSILITADCGIAEEKLSYQDYLEKALQKAWPRDNNDWRDDSNQDIGAGRLI